MDMKTFFRMTTLCLALGGVGISHSVLAYDAKITLRGTVKASPCKIDAVGGDVNVKLDEDGEIKAHTLTAGKGSNWKDFSLDLSECPASTTEVTAKFSGEPATESPDLYKNIATTTPAGAVQVEMGESTSGGGVTRLGNNSTMKVLVDHKTNKAIFPLKARVFSANGGVTPGSVEGIVQVELTYK